MGLPAAHTGSANLQDVVGMLATLREELVARLELSGRIEANHNGVAFRNGTHSAPFPITDFKNFVHEVERGGDVVQGDGRRI